MATRSRIGIVNADSTVTSIYCHWDGSPDYNGAILVEHYNTESKIRELMALGDISSLSPNIGVKHDFDFYHKSKQYTETEFLALQNMCNAYGRDRGETGIEAQTHKFVNAFLSAGEAYNYLWHNNQWQCFDWENQTHNLYHEAA
jgi:hypothetical protein